MRFKPIPEPPIDDDGIGAIAAVLEGVPRRPNAQSASGPVDCCARLVDRTSVADRERAADWLTFLRALGLVCETENGFVRGSDDLDPAAIRRSFRDRVSRAGAVLETLEAAPAPLDVAAAADRSGTARARAGREDGRQGGERGILDRDRGRERTKRLLGWAVALDLADRVVEGETVRFDAAGPL